MKTNKRYIHPDTKASVVIDTASNTVIHVGRPDYKYWSGVSYVPDIDGGLRGVVATMPVVEINVLLPDERISVWRPTQAEDMGNRLFKILPLPDGDFADEKWEFVPGSIVWAEIQMLYQAMELMPVLVAVKAQLN